MSDFVLICFFVLAAAFAFLLWLLVKFATAAYFNGVVDGYGYSKEPNCPGYSEAGRLLREHMAHRWLELRDKP